ncbi:hypothetical protein C448_11256 [Halococcus morrhuae DSM 1307]|uniref:Sialidase n=1 Tax=Halococcus morrhuae DSM 1307 TaxID=931277 RepID=M0MD32_HALMO|nr:hypothetical protein [Halococcus morrhuae]EMA42310.1 hypothetical protein C448_11256 [Halococcus morrhuae DSM 1307]
MNRAALAAVLVVLLTIQGSVVGVLTGDVLPNESTNNGSNTTVEQPTEVTTVESPGTGSTSVMAANNEGSHETSATTANSSEESTTTTTTENTTTSTSTETETSTETDTTTSENPESTNDNETSDTTDESGDSGEKSPPKPESPTQSPTDEETSSGDNGGEAPSEGESPSSGAGEGGAPQGDAGSATPPASGSGGAGGPSRSGGASAPPAGAGQPSGGSDGAAGRPGGAAAGAAPPGAGAAPSGSAPNGAAGGAPRAAAGGAGGSPSGAAAGGAPSGAAGAAGAPSAAGANGAPGGAAAGGAAGSATGASPDAEFNVTGVSADVSVGGTGNVSVTIENTGEDATDAVVSLQSQSSDLVFGQSAETSRYVGDWDEGESRTVEVTARAMQGADTDDYPVQATVSYDDDDGNASQSAPLTFGVSPASEQEFTLSSVDGDLAAGSEGTISGTITNDGPEQATDAVITLSPNGSRAIIPRQSQYVIGGLDPDESEAFEYPVLVNSTAEPGARQVSFVVQYYDADGNPLQSKPLNARVDIDAESDDFAVVSSSSDVQVGDEGPVSVTLENQGENVSEATVSLQSLTGDILFGRTANATQFIGEWPAGAQRTVTVNATASNQSETRSYPLQTSISYKDSDGDPGRSGPFTVGITPQSEQSFALGNTSSTLSVGDEGNVTGTITNRGPQDAGNAVIKLISQSQNVKPQSTEVALGSLPANGSTSFSVPVEVTDSAEPGGQQFSFVVEYDNRNGDTRRSGTLDTQVDIGAQSDAFIVERANASLDVGGSDTVTLNVTNNRESTVSNVNAKAFVDDPLSIASDEAYISRLEPNETQQIAFEASAGGDANAGEYPLSVDFQYDSGGESKLSNTYEVPIELVEVEDGGILSSLSVMWALGALLVVFGIGWVWSRRS